MNQIVNDFFNLLVEKEPYLTAIEVDEAGKALGKMLKVLGVKPGDIRCAGRPFSYMRGIALYQMRK
jgi:hypothetical protein